MSRNFLAKLFLLCVFAWVLSFSQAAKATNVSTANPNYPAGFDDIDSQPLREQFNKIINDIDNLWAAIGPNFLEANQLLGALLSGKAQALPMPSCFSLTNALTWRPGLGFGCNDIQNGGGGSLGPAPALTVIAGPLSGQAAAPTAIALTGNYLPLPSANSIGGVKSASAGTHQFMNGISTSGSLLFATPSFADITGILGAAQLPTPTPSSLGGTESIAVVPHNFLTGISLFGVPTQAQPSFADISGNISMNQIGSGVGATSSTVLHGDGTWSTASGVTPVLNGGTGSAVGNAYSLSGYQAVQGNSYHPYGDSISCGYGAGGTPNTCNSNGFANLLAVDQGASLVNNAFPGDQVCDMSIRIFADENPGSTKNSIYTTLIGTNDANVKGVGSYEAGVYDNCLKASLAWLAIPSAYKTFAQNCSITGTWSNDNTYISGVARSTTTAGSTMTCTITTTGGPIYLFYKMFDTPVFNFSYTVDGGSPVTVNCQPSPAIATQSAGTSGHTFTSITGLSAGTHTIVITLPSTNPGISTAGIATPALSGVRQGYSLVEC